MVRIFGSLLVIIGLLVGSLAEVPHCHANIYDDVPHHELAPHFHLSWIHLAPTIEVGDSLCIPLGAGSSCGEPTHDSDAIYLQLVTSTRYNLRGIASLFSAPIDISWICQVNPRFYLALPCRFSNTTLGVSTDLYLRLNVLRN